LKRFDTAVYGVTDDYEAITGSDVVVIACGSARKPGMEREDLISTNFGIIKDVSRRIADHSPKAVIIVVSNPLDVLCHCVYYYGGFPANRVIGMSGTLDVARYKSLIAQTLHVSIKDIQALILGGHGETMVPIPRYTTIGGIPLLNLMDGEKVQELIHRTQFGGDEIINHLGRSGWYAAGAAICEIVEAVILDQKRVLPVCAYLDSEYGCRDIFLGVPVILGKNGVEKVIELELDSDDKEKFRKSQEKVKKTLMQINV